MCELISGYSSGCDTVGGVKTLYAWDPAYYAAPPVITAGTVDAFTLSAGKYAYAFNVEMETATFTDTAIGDRSNKAYAREQSLTVVLHGNTPAMIEQIDILCAGRTSWAVELNDGTFEVLFLENGAKCLDVRTPGTAFEDGNMNTLTFTGKEKTKAPNAAAGTITALVEVAP
jgi:hypothetical protein